MKCHVTKKINHLTLEAAEMNARQYQHGHPTLKAYQCPYVKPGRAPHFHTGHDRPLHRRKNRVKDKSPKIGLRKLKKMLDRDDAE